VLVEAFFAPFTIASVTQVRTRLLVEGLKPFGLLLLRLWVLFLASVIVALGVELAPRISRVIVLTRIAFVAVLSEKTVTKLMNERTLITVRAFREMSAWLSRVEFVTAAVFVSAYVVKWALLLLGHT
jgi:hypothetical protein